MVFADGSQIRNCNRYNRCYNTIACSTLTPTFIHQGWAFSFAAQNFAISALGQFELLTAGI
jgi:hypothetical protein